MQISWLGGYMCRKEKKKGGKKGRKRRKKRERGKEKGKIYVLCIRYEISNTYPVLLGHYTSS